MRILEGAHGTADMARVGRVAHSENGRVRVCASRRLAAAHFQGARGGLHLLPGASPTRSRGEGSTGPRLCTGPLFLVPGPWDDCLAQELQQARQYLELGLDRHPGSARMGEELRDLQGQVQRGEGTATASRARCVL